MILHRNSSRGSRALVQRFAELLKCASRGQLSRRSRPLDKVIQPLVFESLESRQFLGNRGRPTKRDVPSRDGVQPAAASSNVPGYSPAEIASAYGFNKISFDNGAVAGDGTGQTIAIVDAFNDPNIDKDLSASISTSA